MLFKIFLSVYLIIIPVLGFAGAPNCSFNSSSGKTMDMGDINPYNYTNVVLPITITIDCQKGDDNPQAISYTYSIGPSSNGGGASRKMDRNNNYVNYYICTSTNCTSYYGDGTGGTVLISNSYSMDPSVGRTDSWTLYYTVPVQPLSVYGDYSDQFVGTLSYSY